MRYQTIFGNTARLGLVLAMAMAAGPMRAQNQTPANAPPPPSAVKAAGPAAQADANGPGLEVTMTFIQDAMNGQGKIQWSESNKSADKVIDGITVPGLGIQEDYAFEISDAVADPKTCSLSFHSVTSRPDSGSRSAMDGALSFREAASIAVRSQLDIMKEIDHQVDPDNKFRSTISVFPNVYKLTLKMASGKTARTWGTSVHSDGTRIPSDLQPNAIVLSLSDEDLARRLAKAMTHAIELCGGGKDPF